MRMAWLLIVCIAACGDVVKKQDVTCDSAAQCTDPAEPYCVNQMCQAGCAMSSDCTDPGRDVCAPATGECVGCVSNADCDATAPVCDTTARSCRGCTMDSECNGGVCIEADGTCTADATVAFVAMLGNDTAPATCTRAAPCATIPFALNAGKKVIHVLGGSLFTNPLILNGNVILDGENTTLSVGNTSTTVTIRGGSDITVEGFRISAPTAGSPPQPAVQVSGPTHARLYGLQINGDGAQAILASGATVELSKSHIGSLAIANPDYVNVPNSTVKLDQNVFEMTIVDDQQTSAELTVTRNHFESSRDGSVRLSNGRLVMENNVIIHSDGFNDSLAIGPLQSGSTFRYNTMINTTPTPSDGAALGCDSSLVVTSNIFAYNSMHPIVGNCTTKYSVFDDRAVTAAGTGNQTTPIDQIFVNRAAGDYHLSATSIAKGNAEPGLTMTKVDFEGNPRPNPTGTNADSGAYEAP